LLALKFLPWISKWSKKNLYESPQLSAAEDGEGGGGSGDGAEGDGDGIGVGVAGVDEADIGVSSSANPSVSALNRFVKSTEPRSVMFPRST
jgi:hypothetical protein